jgi:protein SCO1/2
MARTVTTNPDQVRRAARRALAATILLAAVAGIAIPPAAAAQTVPARSTTPDPRLPARPAPLPPSPPVAAAAAALPAQFAVLSVGLLAAPDVAVTSMSGVQTRLTRALDADAPLVLNFVFTTCSATCPLQTATLAEVQRRLAANGAAARFVSVTIDPDNDTPEQLARYARTFHSGPGWDFYTGSFNDLLHVQQAFGVYRGAKMSHPPVLLMRRSRSAPWLRLEGFPTPADVVRQIGLLPAG